MRVTKQGGHVPYPATRCPPSGSTSSSTISCSQVVIIVIVLLFSSCVRVARPQYYLYVLFAVMAIARLPLWTYATQRIPSDLNLAVPAVDVLSPEPRPLGALAREGGT
eukprot:3601398-Rhodomonas_salina.1